MRIHSGLRSGLTVFSILTGIRAIFSAPRNFSPATIGFGLGRELVGLDVFEADSDIVIYSKW